MAQKTIYAQCQLEYDSPNNAPKNGSEATEGFFRLRHVEGYPLTISGYAKYLPASENFVFKVNYFPTDEFHDCSSTGGNDKLNPASDLPEMVADETGLAWYDTVSQEITLMGEASALGKSLALYALDTSAKVA